MTAVESLKSVLCGPDGKCCIAGSAADRKTVDDALDAMDAQALRIAELKEAATIAQECVVSKCAEIYTLRAELDIAKLHIKHIGNDALRTENHELRVEPDALKAPTKPVPLTDDDIDAIGVDYRGDYRKLREFARTIEAHIKGEQV